MRTGLGALPVAILCFLVGCPGPDLMLLSDGGAMDSAPDVADGAVCAVDDDCDDGEFCSGLERCDPSRPMADARGCVAATAGPCMPTQTCDETTDACLTACDLMRDADGDGADSLTCGGLDCDDADPDRAPGLPEICDGAARDEDCDPATPGARDADRDGFDDASCCNGTGPTATCGEDCDDLRRNVSPLASEVCDRVDNDCDAAVDEGTTVPGFRDSDRDGRGDPAAPIDACAGTAGFSADGDDCDDADRSRSPLRVEICDAVDNDCDTRIDEDAQFVVWYRDRDGDGSGAAAGGTRVSCMPPAGYALDGDDCDDADPARSPGAPEVCNGADDDCNGRADAVVGPGDFEDDDGDGLVDARCMPPGADCDDSDATSGAAAPEICDGRDNDCDGRIDEDASSITWYPDSDGDGFGADAPTMSSCTRPLGHASRGGDCADTNPMRSPGLGEVCNSLDDDCDAMVDENVDTATDPGNCGVCGRRCAAIESCVGGTCVATRRPCTMASECEDGSVCTIDTCGPGGCDRAPTADGAPCTGGTCRSGVCCTGCVIAGTCIADGARDPVRPCFACSVATSLTSYVELGNGATCDDAGRAGLCLGTPRTCCGGCWDGLDCQAGTSPTSCGSGGATCAPCPCDGDLCTGGACAPTMPFVAAVAQGRYFTCALDRAGQLWCWGLNSYGQLGQGDRVARDVPTRVGTASWQSIAAQENHVCGIQIDGSLWCWGSGAWYSLGLGDTSDRLMPTRVGSASDWVEVAVDVQIACGRHGDGTLDCWGSGGGVGVGTGDMAAHPTPTRIVEPRAGLTWSYVDVGGSPTVTAIASDGTLWCWGANSNYECGVGHAMPVTLPTQVGTGAGWTRVTTNGRYACGIRSGRLFCWGSGEGTCTATFFGGGLAMTPAQIGVELDWTAIAIMSNETLARRADGTLWYCGVIPGTTFNFLTPTQRFTGTGWVEPSLSAGTYCVTRPDDTLVCWGNNGYGELGLGGGDRAARSFPARTRVCFDPSPLGCADGTVEQFYGATMHGCNGAETQCDASRICASGWHVCTYDEYAGRGGASARPTAARWLSACIRDGGAMASCPSAAPCSTCTMNAVASTPSDYDCAGAPTDATANLYTGVAAIPMPGGIDAPHRVGCAAATCAWASSYGAGASIGAACCR